MMFKTFLKPYKGRLKILQVDMIAGLLAHIDSFCLYLACLAVCGQQ